MQKVVRNISSDRNIVKPGCYKGYTVLYIYKDSMSYMHTMNFYST